METNAPGSMLAKAIAIAAVAHQHQVDKVGRPYIMHPLRMMMRAETEEEQIVALLHDLVEDCPGWTFDRLRQEGFSDDIIAALDGVTAREGESYEAFVDRAASNPIARRVKILDLEANMTLTRLPQLTDRDLTRLQKYHRAYRRLKDDPSTDS